MKVAYSDFIIGKKTRGFTIVELIVVVSILAILSTLAFLSISNYIKNARNANRISSIKTIEQGLQNFQIKTGTYPQPENSFILMANNIPIGYQGFLGKNVSTIIHLSTTPLDPILEEPYIYGINSLKNKYQILSYTEEE